jgi:hypothetical protein
MIMSTLIHVPKSSNILIGILMRILGFGLYIYEGALMSILDFGTCRSMLMSIPFLDIL